MPEILDTPRKRLPKGAIRPLEGTKPKPKKPPVSGPRIVWTAKHVQTMTNAFPALLTEPNDKKRFEIALAAQELLPQESRRTYAALYWLAVRVPDSLKRMLGLLPPLEKKLTPERKAKMQEGKKAHQEARREASKAIDTATADNLAQEIARLEGEKQALEVQAKEATESEKPAPAEPQEEARKRVIRWPLTMYAYLAHDPMVKALIENKSYTPPNVSLVEAIMKAQHKYFPRNAWRPRTSVMQSCSQKPGLLNQLRMGLAMDNPHPKEEAPAAPQEAPVVAAQAQAVPLVAPAPEAGLAGALGLLFAAAVPAIERMLTNAVRAALEGATSSIDERIKAGVRETVIEILGAPVPPPPAEVVAPPQPAPEQERPKKSRVDIVGLLGDQEQVVRAKHGDHFDLRFIGAKEVEHQKITAPVAIMCRKFVSHSAQQRIKKAGANLVYANGGADSVSQHLAAMAA